jgi:hypothetical protein
MGMMNQAAGLTLWLVLMFSTLQLRPSSLPWLFFASLTAPLAAALGLSLIFSLERHRSSKPSDLAAVYLLASVFCDMVALTIPSSVQGSVHRPPHVRCVLHSVLLVLECLLPRTTAPGMPQRDQSPEEASGILSRFLFAWINPILLRGYKSMLVVHDLPHLSADMSAKLSREAMVRSWNKRGG